MVCEITSRGITTEEYPSLYVFTGSSRREETDIGEMSDLPSFMLISPELLSRRLFYRSLLPSFEIDLSSVHPLFESGTRTSLIKEFYEEILPEETLEYDIIVRMPPRKRYTIELEVKSIKKAEPRIVEPAWI